MLRALEETFKVIHSTKKSMRYRTEEIEKLNLEIFHASEQVGHMDIYSFAECLLILEKTLRNIDPRTRVIHFRISQIPCAKRGGRFKENR